MKSYKLLIFSIIIISCNQAENNNNTSIDVNSQTIINDKELIENLIRKVYKWIELNNLMENEMINDDKDSIYIGFDLNVIKSYTGKLKKTNFFSDEFLENYLNIYKTLDKKLKNKDFEWFVGELPPFGNDANPWCNCQDYPENYWDSIKINNIKFIENEAKLTWTWGNGFEYKVGVIKENEQWKIDYLEGFDLNEFTKTE